MNIRSVLLHASACAILALAQSTYAISLSDLTDQEASGGLKAEIEQGANSAVSQLGTENGFLNNDKVRIELPRILQKAKPLLKMAGKGDQLDELEIAMNHAAEQAVPLARALLINAVKSMSVEDARKILTGGETSVTEFFREKTEASLSQKFLPIVKKVTDKVGLSRKYDSVMSQASKYTSVPPEHATVEAYVTKRAMDGLYYQIAEQEKAIRRDPLGSGSKLISKVFGSLM